MARIRWLQKINLIERGICGVKSPSVTNSQLNDLRRTQATVNPNEIFRVSRAEVLCTVSIFSSSSIGDIVVLSGFRQLMNCIQRLKDAQLTAQKRISYGS
jgi:hypothetical protein